MNIMESFCKHTHFVQDFPVIAAAMSEIEQMTPRKIFVILSRSVVSLLALLGFELECSQ